jgi:hypothetical protein
MRWLLVACLLLEAGCLGHPAAGLPELVGGTVTIAPGAHLSYGVLLLQGQSASWTWSSDAPLYTDVSAQQANPPGIVDGDSQGSSGTYKVTAYSDHMAFTWGNRGSTPIHLTFEVRSDGQLEWKEA